MFRGASIVVLVAVLSMSCFSEGDVIFRAKKTAPGKNEEGASDQTPVPPESPEVDELPPTPTSLPPDFPFPPELGLTCRVERGFIREGSTFNDPSKTITGSPEECCAICGLDDNCIVWTRNRVNGACSLKFEMVELNRNHDFDSGVIGGAPAAQDIPEDTACVAERGVEFTGEVLSESETETVDECCRMCENNGDCFAWSRDRSSGVCSLKQSFDGRNPTENVDGGTIF